MKKYLTSHKLTILFLLLTVVISGILYKDSFGAYFFQDDWFTLTISQAQNFRDILDFFIPRTDIIYYRPFGMQVPFFLISILFGTNPLPFHILVFLTHILNIFLVYKLSFEILRNKKLSAVTAFLYSTSAVHFIPFYWASTYPFVLGPTFFFLSFWLFSIFVRLNGRIFLLLSLVSYIFGLLVNEMVITLPVIVSVYLVLNKIFKKFIYIAPYFFIVMIFIIFRFIIFVPPTVGLYRMEIGNHLLSNLKAYFFWSFNWSEVMTEQMVRPFVFNELIMQNYGYVAYLSIITFLIFTLFIIYGGYQLYKSESNKTEFKILLLGISWFVVGLSPVLLFPSHKFSYYLPISLCGLLIALVTLYNRFFRSPLFIGILLFSWVLISYVSINYNKQQHWAPRRSTISRNLTNSIVNYAPFDKIIRLPDQSENRVALNGQDAVKYLLGQEFSIIYEK